MCIRDRQKQGCLAFPARQGTIRMRETLKALGVECRLQAPVGSLSPVSYTHLLLGTSKALWPGAMWGGGKVSASMTGHTQRLKSCLLYTSKA